LDLELPAPRINHNMCVTLRGGGGAEDRSASIAVLTVSGGIIPPDTIDTDFVCTVWNAQIHESGDNEERGSTTWRSVSLNNTTNQNTITGQGRLGVAMCSISANMLRHLLFSSSYQVLLSDAREKWSTNCLDTLCDEDPAALMMFGGVVLGGDQHGQAKSDVWLILV
jgi:hypothetical protein